jgi:hypothetical protein
MVSTKKTIGFQGRNLITELFFSRERTTLFIGKNHPFQRKEPPFSKERTTLSK